jgi:murein tripeptide amidase MpaA
MRHYLFVAVSVAFLAASAFAGDMRYSKIRILLHSPDDLKRLGALGLAVEEGTGKRGQWFDIFVNSDEAARLQSNGFAYTVLIDDWKKFYDERQRADQVASAQAPEGTTVKNFHLGTMGGCLTYKAVLTELDSMKNKYPSIITARESIGRTFENRALWMVKISENPTLTENKPRVLYTGLHHAREGAGMMHVIYFMWYLLENYGVDADVTSLLDHRELYFVPVVNPDGYAHNESTNPTGGGMWRKNMFNGYGIDLNRNYGYKWGFDNNGSSPSISDETYRGSSGFSEFETQAIRDLCNGKKFSATLNYHTYSNQLIYPWGYSDRDSQDSSIFRSLCDDMTAVNHYTYGTGSQTVGYVTNGDSDDWMYGDTTQRGKIFSMTPEIGNDGDGFWPSTSRILPLAQENLQSDLYLAHAAGKFVAIAQSSVAQRLGNDTLTLSIYLTDKGLIPAGAQVDVSATSDVLKILSPATISIDWKIGTPILVRAVCSASAAHYGEAVRVQCFIRYDGESTRDSVIFRLGVPQTLFSDDGGSNRSQWIATTNIAGMAWDSTSRQSHSGRTSYSQTTTGFYPDLLTTMFVLDKSFHLEGFAAELRFWLKWNVETDYDFARVEISTDNGSTWKAQSGKYTKDWVTNPGYFGVRYSWVEEVINISAYLGKDIKIRFSFVSDQAIHYEGIYIDDIALYLYPINYDSVAQSTTVPALFSLDQNYPNPFNPTTEIHYSVPTAERVTLKVYDVLGREVATLFNDFQNPGFHAVRFNAAHLSSGSYIVRLSTGAQVAVKKMILIK